MKSRLSCNGKRCRKRPEVLHEEVEGLRAETASHLVITRPRPEERRSSGRRGRSEWQYRGRILLHRVAGVSRFAGTEKPRELLRKEGRHGQPSHVASRVRAMHILGVDLVD